MNRAHLSSEFVPPLAPATGLSADVHRGANDRGVALIITLLLLFLMSIIGLAAVLTSSSDMLINGYYSNYRGSFYAADSGINIARQTIQNNLNPGSVTWNAAWPCVVGTTSGPLPANLGSTVANQIVQSYGATTYLTGSHATSPGAGQNSWAESFKITTPAAQMISLAANSPVPGGCGSGSPTSYQYTYNYSLTSVGSATGSEQSTITESGAIIISVSITPTTENLSYAYYGAFITNYAECLGPLVPGTMTGPMFTDGAWGFMPGSYIFTDPVGQQDANASFFDSGWNCHQVAASSWSGNGQTIAPQFQEGFQLSQPPVAQPADSYSQEWAVIDGRGMNETNSAGQLNGAPTNTDLNSNLKTITGSAYPAGGATSGIYLNYSTVNGVPTINGGGLYVEGNASIVLTPSGASAQVYTITNNGVTTTMTVDPVANTTVVTTGGNSLTLSGVPMNLSTSPSQPGTMIYVDGAITGLTGPGEGQGAVQNGTAMTIVATGDVNLTGDVRYATEPVTTAANQIPGTPVDTLIPGSNSGQDLGIFTANGNIVMSSPYADDNLEVDGSQAALGANCSSSSCGFLVNGCINTFNNVGGQLQTNIFGACLNVENTYYDRRYNTVPNFAPPWFPGMTITQNGNPTVATTTPILQRTSWVSSSGQ